MTKEVIGSGNYGININWQDGNQTIRWHKTKQKRDKDYIHARDIELAGTKGTVHRIEK